jgi:tetratricopeptide (TPR) repeat protein
MSFGDHETGQPELGHPAPQTPVEGFVRVEARAQLGGVVLLAEEQAKSPEEALEYYRRAVEVGEKSLGSEGFEEYAGHFWGFLETRPYMRARAGLAATLNTVGDVGAAISHYQEMLKLNPNDNQGIRYVLATCLMKSGDVEALKTLLKQFDEDSSALWLYTRALIAFRENGGPDEHAEEFAKKAWKVAGSAKITSRVFPITSWAGRPNITAALSFQ